MWSRNELFVGNRWVKPSGDHFLDVISPTTEEAIGRVPAASVDDIDRAVTAARKAFEEGPWPRMPLEERIDALVRVADEFDRRADTAVELQIDEMGGTRKHMGAITYPVRDFLNRTISDLSLVGLREVRQGTIGDVLVLREPIGVVAGIVPWNGPVMSAAQKLFPSLIMGCPIVVKPAPESPLSAYMLSEAFEAAGLPEGTVSILAGGVEVGEYLVAHRGINMVSFTGSPIGGARIAAACGEQLKSVVLELGGKSAAIVLDDDLATYVPLLVSNALRNSGQVCISPNRILVNDAYHDDLVDRLVEYVDGMKVGDPHDADTDFGPLAASRQRDRVEGYIASGLEQGAKIALGGGRPSGLDRGWFVEPTIFVNVDNSMQIAQEEIFGPVLSILRYRDEDEAVAIANDSMYGLGGSVFCADLERALAVASRIQTGTCQINDSLGAGGGGPFGGVKHSGLGRERSREGLEAFTEVKSIALPAGYKIG